jgi:hypothetical protein
MTAPKSATSLQLRPEYVSASVGATLVCISVDTWHTWVRQGIIPQPVWLGVNGTTPRWRWEDVDASLAGRVNKTQTPFFNLSAGDVQRGEEKSKRRSSASRGSRG